VAAVSPGGTPSAHAAATAQVEVTGALLTGVGDSTVGTADASGSREAGGAVAGAHRDVLQGKGRAVDRADAVCRGESGPVAVAVNGDVLERDADRRVRQDSLGSTGDRGLEQGAPA